MEARAKLLGRWMQQMLIVLALGTLVVAGFFEILPMESGNGRWAAMTYWLILMGSGVRFRSEWLHVRQHAAPGLLLARVCKPLGITWSSAPGAALSAPRGDAPPCSLPRRLRGRLRHRGVGTMIRPPAVQVRPEIRYAWRGTSLFVTAGRSDDGLFHSLTWRSQLWRFACRNFMRQPCTFPSRFCRSLSAPT